MWWQYLIVAIVVGGCVVYLVRGMLRVVSGAGGSSCGSCSCDSAAGTPGPRLGERRDLLQLGIERRRDKTGA